MTTFVYKLELGGLHLEPTVSASTFVGHPTDIWADASNPNILRRGDGVTPGGHVIGPVGTGFSGSYNDLTNLPTIPSDIAQLTDVNNLLGTGGGGFDGSFASLTGIPTTIAGYGITDAFDGDYNNLTNVPVIPTVPTTVSSFSNDSGYITSADLNNLSIDLLQDVDTTVAPTNGQALVWNSTTNVWEPGTVATSNAPENLDDLNDVTYGVVTLDSSNGGGLFLGWSQVDNAWRPLDVTVDWNLVTNKPSVLTSETVTTLSLAANTLSYVDENGAQTDLDLSLYLDDTNAARITQGVYDNSTGLATFTRDDTTTFTVDFNSLLAGAGISLTDISGTGDIAFNQTTGEISFNNNSGYLTSYTETDTLQSVTSRGAVTTTTSVIPFYYADQTAFPNASTYHGAVAHSHSDGAMYFAHGGVWNKLANDSQLSGYVTYTDLSVTQASANGSGALAYDNTTGVFTYTPPDLSSFSTTTDVDDFIYGKADESITKGDVVMFGGASGDNLLFKKADATYPGFITQWIVGIANETMALNDFGYVRTLGVIEQLDTSAYPLGTLLWVDPATPGGLTSTEPSAPNPKVLIAAVTKSNAGDGHILVRPTLSFRMTDLEDVDTSSASDGDYLVYNGTAGVWQHQVLPTIPADVSDLTDTTSLLFDGDYNSLTNQPTIPADVSDLTDTTNLLSSGSSYGDSDVDTHLNTSTASNGDVLQWNGTDYSWATGSGTVIAPFAFARVATTSNGSGTGISWANYNAGNGSLDFTFSSAQPDTNYVVVTDAETFDDYHVGISSKTVNGFTAEFYDSSGTRLPSSFSPFGIIVYGSTPTQTVLGSTQDYAWSSLTGTPTTIAGYGITDAFDGDYNSLTNTPTIPADVSDLTDTTSLLFDGDYTSLTNTPTIPADVSDLTDTTNLLSSGGVALTDLSVTTAANGVASLSYDNTSGVFTFTPPDLSGYLESGGTINVSSIEPTATTSGDGDDLTITGGDATDLNSQGGDTIITGGSGALTSGSVDIGTTQTDAITIGATGISTTIGDTLTVNGNATFESGTFEAFSTITGASGTVTHDCDNGHIFYHTSPSANFTANFTNLGLSTNYGTGITLVIDQGATARIPSAVQTDGNSRTIVWQGGSAPSGTNNGVDVVSFSILRTSGSYIVLGQLVDFA